jgi:hypothetical protein
MIDPEDLMIEMSNEIGTLSAALAKAQAEMGNATKDANNPAFKTKYATLEAVVEAAKPLARHGIACMQFPTLVGDGAVAVTTMLSLGEQWIRSTLAVPVTKRDAQGLGSAITYGRRYSLMSVLGIAPEDDDGNAAVARAEQAIDENRVDQAEMMLRQAKSLEALAEAWKSPLLQTVMHQAPKAIADRITAAKDERKTELSTKEAA